MGYLQVCEFFNPSGGYVNVLIKLEVNVLPALRLSVVPLVKFVFRWIFRFSFDL